MDLDQAMRTTFAARQYTGDPLPDALLYRILDAARFAPSGGNRQGTRVILIRNRNTRAEIARLAEPAAKRYLAQLDAGEAPWNTVVPSALSPEQIAATPVPGWLLAPYTEAEVLLVFVVDLHTLAAMDQELDRIGLIGGASVYPFVWNVLLGARAAGFGGTITTLPAAQEPALQRLLRIPQHHAVCALVPLGKPVRQLTRLKRLSVEQLAMRETFDGPAFTG